MPQGSPHKAHGPQGLQARHFSWEVPTCHDAIHQPYFLREGLENAMVWIKERLPLCSASRQS